MSSHQQNKHVPQSSQSESLRPLARLSKVDIVRTRIEKPHSNGSNYVEHLNSRDYTIHLTSVGLIVTAPGIPAQFLPMHLVKRGFLE